MMGYTYKVNQSSTTTHKIEELNTMIMALEGLIDQTAFNGNEIEALYSGVGFDRKYIRNAPLGHSLVDYGNWSVLKNETGYSIWKITPEKYDYSGNNELYFDNKVVTNLGDAASESATTFSGSNGLVLTYDGATYTDHTTEAGSEGGAAFTLMDDTSDFLYLGSDDVFKGIKLEFNTRGSNYNNIVELYHSGAGWVGLTAVVDNVADNTLNFMSDGNMTWDLDSATGSGWIQNEINGHTKYWARVKTTTVPVTAAKVNYLIPSSSVIGLLSLSSSEVLSEEWAWCTYESSIYVTIRNSGSTNYEGDYYITSTSSNTNKQNFFVYNHEYKLNHVNSDNTTEPLVGMNRYRTVGNNSYLEVYVQTGSGMYTWYPTQTFSW